MGRGQNGIGNREIKDLICTTHGHELRWGGMLEGWGVQCGGGIKGEDWENCNSMTNKIYFKNKNKNGHN